MMDIGTGIAVGITSGSAVLGAVAIVFKIFNTKSSPKTTDVCMVHSGITEAIASIKDSIDEMAKDVKELIKKVG